MFECIVWEFQLILLFSPPASGIPTLPCGATSIIPSENNIFRARAEMFIYLDVAWPHHEIQPAVAHLLNNLDVNRFGTVYTLLNAMDGSVIVPRTNTLSELYTTWNLTTHQSRKWSGGSILQNILMFCSSPQIPKDSACETSWRTSTCAAPS